MPFNFAGLTGFLNRDYSNAGIGLLLSQRATPMKPMQINPLYTKVLSCFIYWFADMLRYWNPTTHCWTDSICFNEVQMELGRPLRESCRLFPLKSRSRLSFISIIQTLADYSDVEQLGIRCWWHVWTHAGCWGDETVALQSALITHHWQQ